MQSPLKSHEIPIIIQLSNAYIPLNVYQSPIEIPASNSHSHCITWNLHEIIWRSTPHEPSFSSQGAMRRGPPWNALPPQPVTHPPAAGPSAAPAAGGPPEPTGPYDGQGLQGPWKWWNFNETFSGWWLTYPSEQYESIGMISPSIWKIRKCSKPPTSY